MSYTAFISGLLFKSSGYACQAIVFIPVTWLCLPAHHHKQAANVISITKRLELSHYAEDGCCASRHCSPLESRITTHVSPKIRVSKVYHFNYHSVIMPSVKHMTALMHKRSPVVLFKDTHQFALVFQHQSTVRPFITEMQ